MILKDYEKIKRGYAFGVPTHYNSFHIGLDLIVPKNTPVYAWADLEIVNSFLGKEGGNTAWIKVDGRPELVRLLHLNEPAKKGKYKKDVVIAKTGNTGLSTGPHLHQDVSINGKLELSNKKNFTDPEKYNREFNDQECKHCLTHCPK